MQRQVCLGNDPDHASLLIHNRPSADLVVLHQAFTAFDVFTIATGDWVRADELLNGSGFRVQSVRNNRAAEVAVGNDADQRACQFIGHYRHRTDASVAHYFCHRLSTVVGCATSGVAAHDFANFHETSFHTTVSDKLGLLFDLDFVHDIAIARVRTCNLHGEIVLLGGVHCA